MVITMKGIDPTYANNSELNAKNNTSDETLHDGHSLSCVARQIMISALTQATVVACCQGHGLMTIKTHRNIEEC